MKHFTHVAALARVAVQVEGGLTLVEELRDDLVSEGSEEASTLASELNNIAKRERLRVLLQGFGDNKNEKALAEKLLRSLDGSETR